MSEHFELDSLLKQMAENHQPQLPSPGLIWWRAQILRKQQEKAHIERPLIVMRLIAVAVCCVAVVLLLAANWNGLQRSSGFLMPVVILAMVVSAVSVSVFLRLMAPKT